MINLKNRNVLLTGATGGIGKYVAEELAKEGCNLILTSRSKNKLKRLSKCLFEKYNVNIDFIANDFSYLLNYSSFEIDKPIDIIINCAGVFDGNYGKEYDKLFNVNVRLPLYLIDNFTDNMKKNKWGRIVNIGSSSSYTGTENTIYCASKHALLGLSRSFAKKLKPYNIRVYCVSPAGVKTNMGKLVKSKEYKNFLNPKEVAQYIVYIIKYDKELITDEIKLNRFK